MNLAQIETPEPEPEVLMKRVLAMSDAWSRAADALTRRDCSEFDRHMAEFNRLNKGLRR